MVTGDTQLLDVHILNYKRNPSVPNWGNSGKIIEKLKYMSYDILKQTIMHQIIE